MCEQSCAKRAVDSCHYLLIQEVRQIQVQIYESQARDLNFQRSAMPTGVIMPSPRTESNPISRTLVKSNGRSTTLSTTSPSPFMLLLIAWSRGEALIPQQHLFRPAVNDHTIYDIILLNRIPNSHTKRALPLVALQC